jgi:signal transduction histidine kinase
VGDSDPQLLRRIVQNFLANAIRHAHRAHLLGCRRRGRGLIEVWDTGPGIAQSDRELIFEEFRRLGHSGEAWDSVSPSPTVSPGCSTIACACSHGSGTAPCSRSRCRWLRR